MLLRVLFPPRERHRLPPVILMALKRLPPSPSTGSCAPFLDLLNLICFFCCSMRPTSSAHAARSAASDSARSIGDCLCNACVETFFRAAANSCCGCRRCRYLSWQSNFEVFLDKRAAQDVREAWELRTAGASGRRGTKGGRRQVQEDRGSSGCSGSSVAAARRRTAVIAFCKSVKSFTRPLCPRSV